MNTIDQYLKQMKLPEAHSHKGQNGKLMIIGGSDLFHAASKWSLDVASKFVDMVFYSSVPSNNELIREAKANFWNGIVVRREDVEDYIKEADCVLIGPGMQRHEPNLLKLSSQELSARLQSAPSTDAWNHDTELVVNYLLSKYADKKWVIDAGALQMILPQLLNDKMIITPHHRELERLQGIVAKQQNLSESEVFDAILHTGVTMILKGPVDYVYRRNMMMEITGGNAGMTKGGTGDVLAGLVAALYCKHDAETAAVVGSYINKRAGEWLYEKQGHNFNASDLVQAVPEVLWHALNS